MKKNNYIIYNSFLIKDNLQSFLIYFDYFSQGYFLPKYFSHPTIRKSFHVLLRICIIILYISKIYKLKLKTKPLRDDAIIILSGSGRKGSTIKLIRRNNELKIVKILYNKNLYLKEKKFYDIYKNNKSKIKLPTHKFLQNNTIEIEFLSAPSFMRQIADGTYTLTDALKHFKNIKNEVKILNNNKYSLVHGDLFVINIYIKNNTYYLIDYSESHINNLLYDLYVLLFSILSSYKYIYIKDKEISNYSIEGISVIDLIGTTQKNFKNIEKEFINYRKKRFPNFYNT